MNYKPLEILQRIEGTDIYTAPGLIDLQVNGINGVDFNSISLSKEEVLEATEYLLSRGVTAYFPTIITNADDTVEKILETIVEACNHYSIVNESIAGIHLEGPFLSPEEGARGAHDLQYIKAPDWKMIEKFQAVAEGRIKLITIAPEWKGAVEFIKKCKENNILVSMGHSLANAEDIQKAVGAGLTLSTHLGNAVPLMLKRHPNMLWDQLAEDGLYTMIIADGLHIPDAFIKVVLKVKGNRTLVVSDATRFAGLPSGEYDSTIGGKVILDEENRLSMKGAGGLLAGAAKDILQNVETLINHKIVSLDEAWAMASTNVTDMLKENLPGFDGNKKDEVRLQVDGDRIVIKEVFKNGKCYRSDGSKSSGR